MAGIEGVAGVIAIFQAADRVVSLCGDYFMAVKDAKEDIERLISEIEALSTVLKKVQRQN